ncbi:proteophosphoglycan ppg4 [Rhodotorula toruloides]|uniref:Proteophosphoglycan ppg4 n=1 Tax=Rhodotorula toruloides TaxID=5286 RepID=A0A511KLI1_RHOTO|nr:proteophosphoglycan ppg4 [Rhodotorula toruloides]
MADFSTSVLGFRPFTLDLPHYTGLPYTVAATTTTPVSPAPTTTHHIDGIHGNPHIEQEDSPTVDVLRVVLPTLFGALAFFGLFIALSLWIQRRQRAKEEAAGVVRAKLVRRDRSMRERSLVISPLAPVSARDSASVFELDEMDRQTLSSLKQSEDVARLERSASFKTHRLPRVPPPAYEP